MKSNPLKGSVSLPGDKSISHRALIFSTLLTGPVTIENCSPAEDCQSTAQCLKALGVQIDGVSLSESLSETKTGATGTPPHCLTVHAKGMGSLKEPKSTLFAGNSGTTMRLLSGLLAGQNFKTVLDGDESLRGRPMNRVIKPLGEMGAKFEFVAMANNGYATLVPAAQSGYAPFQITGGNLQGKQFNLEIASAQVETSLLLAGLQAEGTTTISLPNPVRDHTNRMFRYLEVPISCPDNLTIAVEKLSKPVNAKTIRVPADMSSAAFFLVAGCLIDGSDILIVGVGMNPGRLLILEVLIAMGASIAIENVREFGYEPVADLRVRFNGQLAGTTVTQENIARGIDEIPILALAGALCQGEFVVSGAQELRYKESDRLKAITENLLAAGAKIKERDDGFIIEGQSRLRGGSLWKTYNDHRLAMTGLIARLVCEEGLEIEETESIKISYPGFIRDLEQLSQ